MNEDDYDPLLEEADSLIRELRDDVLKRMDETILWKDGFAVVEVGGRRMR